MKYPTKLALRGEKLVAKKGGREFVVCRLKGDVMSIYQGLVEAYIGENLLDGAFRFINRYAADLSAVPDWLRAEYRREQGKSRPKETKEVAPTSETPSEESEVHGGDGNSGEVDAPAETDAAEEREDENSPVDLSKAGESDSAASEGELEDAPEVEMPENRPPNRHGSAACRQATEVPDTKDVQCLVSALRRLFRGWLKAGEELGGELASPRLDGAAFVREMVTRRWNTARVFRQELEAMPDKILVAADVSGSCSASSGHTVGICEALTKVWPELIFVTHSNGRIISVAERGVVSESGVPPTFSDLVVGKKVRGVLLFGDADGLSELEPVWQEHNCPVVWLDSYCASYGVVRKHNYRRVYKDCVSSLKAADGDPLFYVGVNNSAVAARAIRMALKDRGCSM